MEGFKFLFRPVLSGLYFSGKHAYPLGVIFCTAMLSTFVLGFIFEFSVVVERSVVVFFGSGTILFILGVWRFMTVRAREEKVAESFQE